MTIETDSVPAAAAINSVVADFVSMPDLDRERDEERRPPSIVSDSASLRAVAEQRPDPRAAPIVREYLDRDGKKVPQNESITLARASRDYSSALAAERLVAESETSKTLAARVDALRTEVLAHDPGAGEFYGFELPEVKADQAESAGDATEGVTLSSADSTDERPAAELAPEVEKALQHPQIRQAIEEQLGEVEKARQEYLGGLAA